MPGRPWSPEGNALIRDAAAENLAAGLKPAAGYDRRGYANRLAAVADQIGRSYEATRKRAQRLGARSYRAWDDHSQWRRR